ncbi:ABC transporter substrate-binding protein [uncultured Desulfuromonas sp.]|uniref:ABC transporter substrate-binding protein n=1 Tax=uncultured Desulfuromonas sp. TaxID=181013 RepID=UPI002AAAE295|nr:ABC transporter substrate-binding protein [uncultured Desulfuromonas sp.]
MRELLLLICCVFVMFPNVAPASQGGHRDAQPQRIYGTAPPITHLLYVLGADGLIAVNAPLRNPSNNADDRFLREWFRNLPVLGGWHGNRHPNLEEVLRQKPDLIVSWDTPLLQDKVDGDLGRIGYKALAVNIDDTANYPQVFRQLSAMIGRAKRGEALAVWAEQQIDDLQRFVATIPPDERVRVYYAEGRDGLQTECAGSFHAEPLRYAGGINVHQGRQTTVTGLQSINMEQLLAYDPDVIVVQNPLCYRELFDDPLWQQLTAVQQGRVALVPKTPFNWLDRPPSFMRLIGGHWLAAQFYPQRYPYDVKAKARAFFELFFGVRVDEDDLSRMMFPAATRAIGKGGA